MLEINFNNIRKNYGFENVLNNINFDIYTNDKIALVGENGSGKSTILKLISGDEKSSDGIISIRNKSKIGYLKQELEKENIIVKDYLYKSSKEINILKGELSKLEKGNTIVYIGGKTKTEIKEKIMRYEDSLCALSVASNGIVLGGGITLLSISDKIKCETDGDEILKKVLIVPFVTISKNSGKDYKNILDDIKYNNYEYIYNFKNNELEKMDNTSVLDSKEVLICSLKTAISIASMLLTTNYLVINDINTESTQLNF